MNKNIHAWNFHVLMYMSKEARCNKCNVSFYDYIHFKNKYPHMLLNEMIKLRYENIPV